MKQRWIVVWEAAKTGKIRPITGGMSYADAFDAAVTGNDGLEDAEARRGQYVIAKEKCKP
jgi:hypothetical protein